jgi:hypothetical protein
MIVKEKNLDLGLDVVDGVAGLNLESDSLSDQCFDEDLLLLVVKWERERKRDTRLCNAFVSI